MRLKRSWLGWDRPTKYGPKLFTRVLRDSWGVDHCSANGVTIGDVFVCPTTYFFPFSYTDEADEGSVRPEHWQRICGSNRGRPTFLQQYAGNEHYATLYQKVISAMLLLPSPGPCQRLGVNATATIGHEPRAMTESRQSSL